MLLALKSVGTSINNDCSTCLRVVCEERIQYYDYVIIIFEVLMYMFLDLVKRGVLTLVGEKRRYRNDRYYY